MHNETNRIYKALKVNRHFDLLSELCRDKSVYVVGGAIRDALIGKPISDIDLIFPQDPTATAKEFARQTGGSWFWLDESRLHSRVVFPHSSDSPIYDFAPFRALELNGDLHDRDYTINAVALNLSATTIIDPFNGLDDLKSRLLRLVSDESLRNDPLRILKGIRHATCLGLNVDQTTLRFMQTSAFKLEQVSVERIRQEVWKILAAQDPGEGLRLFKECGVGGWLFGDNFPQALPGMIASLRHYSERWNVLAGLHPYVNTWFEDQVEQGFSRRVLLLFILLLKQIQPDLPIRIAEEWLLGRKAQKSIAALSLLNRDVGRALAHVARNRRALYLWSQRLRSDPVSLLLYLAVYELSDDSLPTDVSTWLSIAEEVGDGHYHDLVNGRWIADCLGIEKGPGINKALELLRNAEINGEVANEEEARNYLLRVYLDSD